MKSIFAMLLALLLSVSAFAEESTIATYDLGNIEAPFDDDWIALENGAEMSVPAEWTRVEPSGSDALSGAFYAAEAENREISISFTESQAADTSALAAEFINAYDKVMIISVNGVEIASYTARDEAFFSFAMLDGEGGLYTMTVAPGPGDAEFAEICAYVMSTLGVYAGEETEGE